MKIKLITLSLLMTFVTSINIYGQWDSDGTSLVTTDNVGINMTLSDAPPVTNLHINGSSLITDHLSLGGFSVNTDYKIFVQGGDVRFTGGLMVHNDLELFNPGSKLIMSRGNVDDKSIIQFQDYDGINYNPSGHITATDTSIFFKAGSDFPEREMRLMGSGVLKLPNAINIQDDGLFNTAIRVKGDEALWYNGSYFSWGFGGDYNFFRDAINIGGNATTPSSTTAILINGGKNIEFGGSSGPSGLHFMNLSDGDINGLLKATPEGLVYLQSIVSSVDITALTDINLNPGGKVMINGHPLDFLNDNRCVFLGEGAGDGHIGVSRNTAIGKDAMSGATLDGGQNTAVGEVSLSNLTSGQYNTAIGQASMKLLVSGSSNVAVGEDALYNLTTSSSNTAIGKEAGREAMGDSSVFIGHQAGFNETGSNKLYIANTDTDTPLIYGEFDNNMIVINGTYEVTSDRRLKTDIRKVEDALPKILSLNGYDYKRLDIADKERREMGVIAQEVQAVFPDAVSTNKNGILSVNYTSLIPVLIEAIKDQQSIIADLDERVRKVEGE